MAAAGAGPLQVRVERPSGEVVAELLVGPNRPVLSLKTQIAGFVGTHEGNQVLLLDGSPMEDDARLSSFGLQDFATVVLVCAKPLLAGRVLPGDLPRLLEDGAVLERAVDAYAEDPRYSAAELQAIIVSVVQALLPKNGEVVDEALREASAVDIRPVGGRAAQRAAFIQAIRSALRPVARALGAAAPPPPPAPAPPPAAAPAAEAAAPVAEAAGREPGGAGGAGGDAGGGADAGAGGAGDGEAAAAPLPFRGAGEELRQKLSRRLALSESAEGGSVDTAIKAASGL